MPTHHFQTRMAFVWHSGLWRLRFMPLWSRINDVFLILSRLFFADPDFAFVMGLSGRHTANCLFVTILSWFQWSSWPWFWWVMLGQRWESSARRLERTFHRVRKIDDEDLESDMTQDMTLGESSLSRERTWEDPILSCIWIWEWRNSVIHENWWPWMI